MAFISLLLWSIIVLFAGAIWGFSAKERGLIKDIEILGSFRIDKQRYVASKTELSIDELKQKVDEANETILNLLNKE